MDTNTPTQTQEAVPIAYPVDLTTLEKRFTYHAPKGDQTQRYMLLREKAKVLAVMIAGLTPPSREQSLAMTHLEDSVMWANAAIARNE